MKILWVSLGCTFGVGLVAAGSIVTTLPKWHVEGSVQNSQTVEPTQTVESRPLGLPGDGSDLAQGHSSYFKSPDNFKLVPPGSETDPLAQVVVIENQIEEGPYGFQLEEGVERQIVVYPNELICGGAPDLDCDLNSNVPSNDRYQITVAGCIAPCEDQWDSGEPNVIIHLASDPLADFQQGDLSPETTGRVIIQHPVFEDDR
ncbi:MAG: hypothetical protein VX095_00730 [Pseudomonadota bacterium]|nr:hypothetical protein [Pseudomonadota bacterium]